TDVETETRQNLIEILRGDIDSSCEFRDVHSEAAGQKLQAASIDRDLRLTIGLTLPQRTLIAAVQSIDELVA
ncbi:MAG: hypothetical protein Q7R80_04285, partial [bacterium]|nr:hypothetical protein [bacterium]